MQNGPVSWRETDLQLNRPDEPVLGEELQVIRLVLLRHLDFRPARLELNRRAGRAVLLSVAVVREHQSEVGQLDPVPAGVHPVAEIRQPLPVQLRVDRLHILQRHRKSAHRH